MYQETVTLNSHRVAWSGTNKFGKPSSLNVFTATDGREFQTFNATIAAQLLATLNTPVTVKFDQKPNGEFINNDVTEIVGGAVAGGAPAPQAAAPAPQAAPAATPGPAPAPPPAVPLAQQEKQLLIMRQKAFGDSIIAFGAAGIDPVVNNAELREFAETVALDYYINGLGETTVEEPVAVDAGETEGPVA